MSTLKLPQEFIQRVLLLSLFELTDQLRCREETHTQTLSASSLAQGDGDVSFPSSLSPNKTTIVLVFDPFPSRQFQDLGLGKLRQGTEVERVEILQDREAGVLDPRRNRVGGAVPQLELGQTEQELKIVLIGRGGVSRQLLELLAHRRQAQLPEVSLQQINHNVSHQHDPPHGNVPKAVRTRRSSPVHGGSRPSGDEHGDWALASSLGGSDNK